MKVFVLAVCLFCAVQGQLIRRQYAPQRYLQYGQYGRPAYGINALYSGGVAAAPLVGARTITAAAPAQYIAAAPAPVISAPAPTRIITQQRPVTYANLPIDETPKPYEFSYQAIGEDGVSSRQESADGSGTIVGSYSLNTVEGTQRTVNYIADANGFRAEIDTNEPGTENSSPANAEIRSSALPAAQLAAATPAAAPIAARRYIQAAAPAPVATVVAHAPAAQTLSVAAPAPIAARTIASPYLSYQQAPAYIGAARPSFISGQYYQPQTLPISIQHQ